ERPSEPNPTHARKATKETRWNTSGARGSFALPKNRRRSRAQKLGAPGEGLSPKGGPSLGEFIASQLHHNSARSLPDSEDWAKDSGQLPPIGETADRCSIALFSSASKRVVKKLA